MFHLIKFQKKKSLIYYKIYSVMFQFIFLEKNNYIWPHFSCIITPQHLYIGIINKEGKKTPKSNKKKTTQECYTKMTYMKKNKRKTHFPFTDDFILLIHIQVQNQLTSYTSQPIRTRKPFFILSNSLRAYIFVFLASFVPKKSQPCHPSNGRGKTTWQILCLLQRWISSTYFFILYML